MFSAVTPTKERDRRMADQFFTDGAAYERLMGRWSRLVGQAFLDWLDVPKELRWLDAGCGNGAFTEELIARCAPATVTAIDPSEEQLAYARSRPGAKAADFRIGDAQKLPFDDASFDAATMALVISFLPKPDEAAAEMARVVRSGGWVATYMWDFLGGGSPVYPIHQAIKSLGRDPALPPNPMVSSREAMQELWQRAGLQSVDTEVIRIPVVYSDLDDFWDSNTVPVGPQGKLIESMSAKERERLRARLPNHLPVASDGRVVYEAFANAVKGRAR
jgi:ubiquinone/menaquinone biosynthesis C-methylase UbiE